MVIERQSNPRKQGDAGMGVAVGYFATQGYTVCLPLTDSQGYDLVVEKDAGLQKVFVRTTTQKCGKQNWECGLRTQGGNKSQFTIRLFDSTSVDLVFIVAGDGSQYLIPANQITTKSSIVVGPQSRFIIQAGVAQR